MDGTGFNYAWGLSPCLDIQDICSVPAGKLPLVKRDGKKKDVDEPFHVLLVHPGDIRHVLKTVSQRRRKGRPERKLHFYILENNTATLARDMLLLSIFCDAKMPIRYRANTFVEVFGNILVQERTERYLEKLGKDLVGTICDERGFLAKIVNASFLKYKVKDELETIFQSYRASIPFDAAKYHDHRQRGLLKSRFDARLNIYDWDYEKAIRTTASIVHIKQYRKWRQDGIAFEFGDQMYTRPNRTLASYAEGHAREGGAKLVRGYWGDIVNSPYPALGIRCDTENKFAADLFRIMNEGSGAAQHRHNAAEIAVFNLLSFLYEMENKDIYAMRKKDEIYSGLGSRDAEIVVDDGEKDAAAISRDDKTPEVSKEEVSDRAKRVDASFRGVHIHLLSGNFESLGKKSRFKKRFDCIYLSNTMVHFLAPTRRELIETLLSDDERAVLVCETARHVVPLKEEQRATLRKKILAMGKSNGYVALCHDSPKDDAEHIAFHRPSGREGGHLDTKDLDDIDE